MAAIINLRISSRIYNSIAGKCSVPLHTRWSQKICGCYISPMRFSSSTGGAAKQQEGNTRSLPTSKVNKKKARETKVKEAFLLYNRLVKAGKANQRKGSSITKKVKRKEVKQGFVSASLTQQSDRNNDTARHSENTASKSYTEEVEQRGDVTQEKTKKKRKNSKKSPLSVEQDTGTGRDAHEFNLKSGFDSEKLHRKLDSSEAINRTSAMDLCELDFVNEDVISSEEVTEEVDTLSEQRAGSSLFEEDSVMDHGSLSYDRKQTPRFKEGTVGGKLFEVRTLAEINGFLNLGNASDAQKLFNRYLRMGKKLNVSTFNKMLHCWAEQGNPFTVKMLHKMMLNEGLRPDMGTYAALLYCYGKYSDTETIKQISQEMSDQGFNPRHIFYKCCLTEQQAKGVLHALRLVNPLYEYEVPASYRQSKSPALVVSLYENRDDRMNALQSEPGRFSHDLNKSTLERLLDEQVSRELAGVTLVQSVEEKSEEKQDRAKELFMEWRSKWREALIQSIEAEMQDIKSGKAWVSMRARYAPFFPFFEPHELADITLDEVIFFIKGQVEGVPLHSVSGALGSSLNTKYMVKHRVKSGMLNKMKEMYHDYFTYIKDENLTAEKMSREYWDELDEALPYGASLQQEIALWPWPIRIVCGCSLLDFLLKSTKIDVNALNNKPEKLAPAFYHSYEFRDTKRVGIIKAHPLVCKLFKGYLASQGQISMPTTALPMLVPPRPWRDVKDGAFLIQPVQLIRSSLDEDGKHDRLLEEKTDRNKLSAIFDSLNILGACAWKTNNRILDLAIHVFNDGGCDKLAVPGPVMPSDPDSLESLPKSGVDPEERTRRLQELRKAKKLAREKYSLRMTALYKLSVANYFRDHVFWLPLNLDFRGRVYPIPPHCSHVGDDLSRGMLLFAKGVPLGSEGLKWLKIHLVNLHGAKKKATLLERAQYADEMMSEIEDSADNPLNGRRWWATADEPWQALATCMEITAALRSPDPSQFVSHQPVHQDGSCNGLQHYAALGRDPYGAKQVNVIPADRPQDVYEEVAKLVEIARKKDADGGLEVAQHLEGKVRRKVVKQTVMTIVYGVTIIGGRLQIERQLRDVGVDEKILFACSSYVVKKVFDSIGELFTAARAIQDWFVMSASQVALSGHLVDWYTPLGLYVCQPYSKRSVKTIKTKLQGIEIHAKAFSQSPPDTRKQKQAFPPNFVHSLDSTHMMLTALYSQRAGITFASVHDSYWTHGANVNVMNKICREKFARLHSQPILEDLQKHFHDNYGNLELLRPLKTSSDNEEARTHASFSGLPEPGDFDVNEVLDSAYFFC